MNDCKKFQTRFLPERGKEHTMGKYFGTDGFRGEANIDLTVEHAYKVGRFLGWYFGKDHKAQIVIGKDTRRSSYMFEYSLVAGLTASGADAYLLHVTTTPSVSYVVRTENFDCGIMISASHNPFYDNGIKVINGLGQKLEADIEAQIEAYIDDGTPKIPFATREDIGRTVDFAAGRNRYIGHLISIPTKSFKNMRVGLDCSNGSASSVAKSVFDAIGAKTYVIHNEPDGTNINCGCGSTHIEELQKYVREKHLDVGFAYDGDADRCIAVDELGNVVDGDLIMYVCGKYLKEKNHHLKAYPLEPSSSPTLSTGTHTGHHRIQGISDEFIPPILDLNRLDNIISVDDGDSIIMAQKLSRELGLGVGISSGANFIGTVKALELNSINSVAVTVFADDNKKYLSTDLMNKEPIKEDYISPNIQLLDIKSL